MFGLLQDVRFGWRMLVKSPVVSLVAALSLAVGIAASAAMFSLASAFWLHPLPYRDQKSLMIVQELRHGKSKEAAAGVSAPAFRDFRQGVTAFASLAAYDVETATVTGGDRPEAIHTAVTTPNLFDVLRVQPALGRGFRPGEGADGAGHVIVISYPYWQQHLAGDPNVLGRTLVLDGKPTTVVGVMPRGFEMLEMGGVQAFRPTDLSAGEDRSAREWTVLGRLRGGASVPQAQAQLTALAGRLAAEHPDADRGWGALVQPLRSTFPGPTDTKLVFILIVVSLFGVAIAGANVANLLLGRAETRIKEIAMRVALGGSRSRILRQLLTESVVLAGAGGALGTAFAVYLIGVLRAAVPPGIPRFLQPTLDVPTLAATVTVAVATGVVFGLAPALHALRGDVRASLGDGGRGGSQSRGRKRIRRAFVIGQVAVALALLTGAGFLGGAMSSVADVAPGFAPAGLLAFRISFPGYRYRAPAELRTAEAEVVRTLQATPGVQGVAEMSSLPRSMTNPSAPFHIVGHGTVPASERPQVLWQAVNPDYFHTMGISLRSGRLFATTDRGGTAPVVVVSREFVRRFLPGEEPLGEHVDVLGTSREIVGVVDDIAQSRVPVGGLHDAEIWLPSAQEPVRDPWLAVRTAGAPAAMMGAIRHAVASVDPGLPVQDVATVVEYMREQMAVILFIEGFVFGLGGLAMALAAMGIYGVMAHSVVQERREIGIRMALGARAGTVVAGVTRRGLVMTAVGLAIGAPLAFAVRRAVFSALSVLTPRLPVDFTVAAVGVLVVAAALASYLPARRAARVDPARVLSAE